MKISIFILILLTLVVGYLISVDIYDNEFRRLSETSGHDLSTTEGLSRALADKKISSIPKYPNFVLIGGALALGVFLAISAASRSARR